MKKILIIDTSNSEVTKVALNLNGEINETSSSSKRLKSQTLLPLIDKLLKKCNTKLEELTEIKINTGPGSYTGIRVGLSVANMLGFLLRIPINGEKKGTFPKYL